MTDGDTVVATIAENTVQNTDGDDNLASASVDNEVTYDTTSPVAPVITSPTPPTSTNNPMPFAGSCSDAPNGLVSVTTTPTGGLAPDPMIFNLDANGEWNEVIIWPASVEGNTYTLQVTCTDETGNGPSPITPAGPITIDTTDPTDPTVISLSPNPAMSGVTVTLAIANVETGASVTVPGMICSPDPATASGTVDCTATATGGLLDGTGVNNVITVTDEAGNTNTNVSSPVLTIDNLAPTGTGTLTSPTPGTPVNNTGATLAGSC